MREVDLYPPLAAFLAAQGFTVRGEVRHCDLAAVRGEELLVVELKMTLNLMLVTQAVRRQAITPSVYVAVPRPPNKVRWMRRMRDVLAVLRRLEIGLLLVSLDPRKPAVEAIAHPEPVPPRQRHPHRRAVLREVAGRSADMNAGGSHRRKLVTAYRENAVQIAVLLAALGPLTPRALRARGTGEKTLAILRRNVYGWFTRVERGLYALTDQGRQARDEYPELAARYQPDRETDATEGSLIASAAASVSPVSADRVPPVVP